MNIRWKWLTCCLTVAGALLPGMQAPLKAESERERELLSWTLIAARSGEPGQLGVKLNGKEKATLDAWIDFDGDGFFNEAEERILDRAAIEPGMSIQTFELPPEAAMSASSRIRFRVDDLEGETLMEREALAFPQRAVDSDCFWSPGFGSGGLNDDALALEVFEGALYVGGSFTLAGGVPVMRVARWDGLEWQRVGGNELLNGSVRALETFNEGNGPRLFAGTDFAPYLFRWTGSTWQGVSGPSDVILTLLSWNDGITTALYVGGQFTRVDGINTPNRIARWTGSGWQSVGTGTNTSVRALTSTGQSSTARLYAGGGDGSGNSFVKSWDRSAWTNHGNPGNAVYALREFGGTVYAGGAFGLVKLQNNSFATTGINLSQVFALEIHDDGTGAALYAGGVAGPLGSLSGGPLAKWTGTSWSYPAWLMDDKVTVLTSHQEPRVAPALFVGGDFGSTNSTPGSLTRNLNVPHIARFDLAGFSSLASGMNEYVAALAADPLNTYASGAFTTAGGLTANRFSRWDGRWHNEGAGLPSGNGTDIVVDDDVEPRKIYVTARNGNDDGALHELQGSTWTLRGDMNGEVLTAAKFGGLLYVGGAFSTIAGAPVAPNRLATWNGSSWGAVGTNQLDGVVNALQVFNFGQSLGTRLVVAGSFSRTGSIPATSFARIAVWNGTSWSGLGGNNQFTSEVRALAVHDDGAGEKLYAAGLNWVARWDNDRWTSIGSIDGDEINVLESFSDGTRPLLAAGGDFISLGGATARNFALWDGVNWNAVGTGFDDDVHAFSASAGPGGTKLYVGGEFVTADGLPSAYIARLECPAPTEFDAAVTMTSTPGTGSTISIGAQVRYEIEVRNNGPATATGLKVEDRFSAHLRSCAWTAQGFEGASGQQNGIGPTLLQFLNLPQNAWVTYVVTCTVAESATGSIANIATLTAAGALDTNPANNQAQVSHTVLPPVHFDAAITMTSIPGSSTSVSAGDQIHYGIAVRNNGPATATGLGVDDVFPAQLRSCVWTVDVLGGATGHQAGNGPSLTQTLNLPQGARVIYDIHCTVTESATGIISNVARLTAAGSLDTNPANNEALVSHTVLAPVNFDAAITMTSIPGSSTSVSPGDQIRYGIEVSNNGPATATGLKVEDVFPAQLGNCSWTVQVLGGVTGHQAGKAPSLLQTLNLTQNARVTYDIICTVADSATGTIRNVATLTAAFDTNPANDQAQVSHTVLAPVFTFDAAVTMTSSSRFVTIENPVVYQIEVRNNGPATATGLKVEGVFPAAVHSCGWMVSGTAGGANGQQSGSGTALSQTLNLPPNAWVTYDVTCTVAASATGSLENIVSLPPDLVPANNAALVTHVVQIDGGFAPGDCDRSRTVDARDFDAFLSEIFDGDGAFPEFTPAPTFYGDPVGCNANQDGTVDAGDLACLTRKLVNRTCPADPLPAIGLPRLAMHDILVIRNRQIEVPVSFDSGKQGINSLAFELHYQSAKVELADHPNAIRFSSLPPNAVIYKKVDRVNHLIELAVRMPVDRTISSSDPLVTLTFDVKPTQTAPTVQRGVGFSARTAASFGNIKGQSVLGLARVRNAVVRTLVITHSTRLFAQQHGLGFGIDQQRQLNASLEDFLEHDRVRGMQIDLATDPDLNELYREWDESGQPAKANEVLFGGSGRRGLHQLLRELMESFDDVEHLLVIGDDRIVPFARIQDDSSDDPGHVTEVDYTNNTVAGGLPLENVSTVKRALAENFFLSDDPLASLENLDLGSVDDEDDFVLPDLGVGRLVENASEILRAFDTFLELDGRLDLQTYDPEDRPVLNTGYDFSIDGARTIEGLWRKALGPVSVDSSLIGQGWFAEDLFEAFAVSGARLYSLNGHATHDLVGSPDDDQTFGLHGLPALDLYGKDLCGNDAGGTAIDLGGAVVIGMSCHGGLPVPGTCEASTTPAEVRTLDLAQTFLARGAMAYGDNSGFGWGLLEGIGLGERLASLIHQRLSGASLNEGASSNVGAAVRHAKLDYYLQQLEFDEFDRKSLMQWTLYGFPMAELTWPGNLAPPPAPASVFVQREAGAGPFFDLPDHMTRRLGEVELSAADYHRVELTEDGEDLLDSLPCPATGCYWQWNGLTTDEVGLPMQPFTIQNTTVATTIQRGVLWMGAEYEVEFPFHPVIAIPASSKVARIPNGSPLPIRIYQQPTGPNGGGYLGEPEGCPGSSATKSQVVLLTGELRRIGADTWEGRRYRSAAFETLHRSVTAADCGAPVFGAPPFDYVENGNLHWRVPVSDLESGVWRVIVVWDDQLAQEWKSVDLVQNGGFWEGILPYDKRRESVTYFLQAVDREGNVAWWERTVDLDLVFRQVLEPVLRQIDAPEPTLFADGFESGDCSAWGSSTGC